MNNFIPLQEASRLTGKSVQTLRRMIKRNKLNHQLSKTPRGHVYLLDTSSIQHLIDLNSYQVSSQKEKVSSQSEYSLFRAEGNDTLSKEQLKNLNSYQPDYSLLTTVQEEKDVKTQNEISDEEFFKKEFSRLSSTIEKLVSQNERDKENFFQLVRTFQDRIVILENHIRLLEAPKKKKRWWNFWR